MLLVGQLRSGLSQLLGRMQCANLNVVTAQHLKVQKREADKDIRAKKEGEKDR